MWLFSKLFSSKNEEMIVDSSDPFQIQDKFSDIIPIKKMAQFEEFKLKRQLGRGTMGAVYEAFHIQTKQQVALKIIFNKQMQNEKVLDRLHQELDVHKKLKDSNIVKLYGIGSHPKGIFIIMEYVDGQNLENYVAKNRKLDVIESLEILVQILKGMSYVHKRKVIHRDLKPANIFIEKDSKKLKIGDLGLAKFTNDNKRNISSTGEILGTPVYMSPEQLHCSKSADIRSDIYSIGCILYYALSGKHPYQYIKDIPSLATAKIKYSSKFINTLGSSVPKQIKKMLAKAVDARVNKRYPNPQSFLKIALKVLKETKKEQEEKLEKQIKESKKKFHPFTTSAFPQQNRRKVDFMGTFVSSSSLEINDQIFQTFQSEIKNFKGDPVQSILSTLMPDEDAKEESILNATIIDSKDHNYKQISNLLSSSSYQKDLIQTINNILNLHKFTREERNLITNLKHSILLRGKTLVKTETIFNIINNGYQYFKKNLDKYSKITPSSSINKKIKLYFQYLIECKLNKHEQIFREGVQNCSNSYQLDSLLENYTFESKSIFKKYPNLKIIYTVKSFKDQLEKYPNNLNKLLNKYFGNQEVHLRNTFEKMQVEDRSNIILELVMKEVYVERLLKSLNSYKGDKEVKKTADKIHNLLSTFLKPSNKISLAELKVALNFIPTNLTNKICLLARRYLSEELNQKIEILFDFKKDIKKRFQKFITILSNPRYQYSTITCFGYPVNELKRKIEVVRYQGKKIAEIFTDIPGELKTLINEDKRQEKASREKNTKNCLTRLGKMKKRQYKSVHLFSNLIKLFKIYGEVNFSKDKSKYISGYQIAQQITIFYRNPSRTVIRLDNNIDEEISSELKEIIDQERFRELKKMKKI